MYNLEGVCVFDCQRVIYLLITHPFIHFYLHQLNTALSILMSMPITHSICYKHRRELGKSKYCRRPPFTFKFQALYANEAHCTESPP